jgi:hypothetical protein
VVDTFPQRDVWGLVEQLSSSVKEHELSTVGAAAHDVLAAVADAVEADAGVILLPNRGQWRVAAGEGLRPREQVARLDRDHPLVAEVVLLGRGLIIDSGAGREQLAGVPLSTWRAVLAAPLPLATGMLLLARDSHTGFNTRDVSAVAGVAGNSECAALSDALALRELARRLARFADNGDEAAPLSLSRDRKWLGNPSNYRRRSDD